jgi:hypothetical protein
MPTSRGSRDNEVSDETVRPDRRPSISATTIETPHGHRRKSARCSSVLEPSMRKLTFAGM